MGLLTIPRTLGRWALRQLDRWRAWRDGTPIPYVLCRNGFIVPRWHAAKMRRADPRGGWELT